MSSSRIGNEELKWIGIDYDDVIAKNDGHPTYNTTEPLDGVREALEEIRDMGYKVTVFTARPWSAYREIEQFMEKHNLPFKRIICGKPLMHKMIDDRNIEFDGDWQKVLKKLQT